MVPTECVLHDESWSELGKRFPIISIRRLSSRGRNRLVARTASGDVVAVSTRSGQLADAVREFEALSLAGRLGLPVPEVCGVVPGVEPMVAIRWVDHEPFSFRRWSGQMVAELGNAIGILHTTPESRPDWPETQHPFDQYLSAFANLGSPNRELTKRLDDLSSTEPQRVEPRFIHGDLRPPNILLSGSGQLVIVDWEYARRSDPYIDLAALLGNSGRPLPLRLASEFRRAYEAVCGAPIDEGRLTWWVAFHALAKRFQIHRLGLL